MKIGIIGYGYWGPNLVRNFSATEGINVKSICDKNSQALTKASKLYHNAEMISDYRDIVKSTELDAIAISTPVYTHFEIAKAALENGKHVFIEKPFTSTAAQAEELINISEKKNLLIMVDHTFLFTDSVRKIKDLVNNDELGNLLYYDSTRVNLGLFQHDVNVIWDLAPHDFSIMDYVLNEEPISIAAHGMDHFSRNLEDLAYITLKMNNKIAHFNVNWLSPVKIRLTLIGGSKKMLVWNDLENDEKIKIYDKGVDVSSAQGVYNLLVSYRSGDMYSPKLQNTEALKVEVEYFRDCILNNQKPFNDALAGLRVVKLLEACDMSLKNNGKEIKI